MSEHEPESAVVSRRDFLQAAGTLALFPPTTMGSADTPVARLYRSLDQDQSSRLCFPSDHPLRSVFRRNWAIVEPTIGDLGRAQQALCREIFEGICSDEGRKRLDRAMADDWGGFAHYHVALFGESGTDGPFEWVLTGRHVTLRADGHRTSGLGFGGPIFYGHGADGAANVWQDQGRHANAIFAALDESEKRRALVTKDQARAERIARLRGEVPRGIGLEVRSLDLARKGMVADLLRSLTAPFRGFDAAAVVSCLDPERGADALRLSYYDEAAAERDRPVWKLEAPGFAWYHHGKPHVHAWLRIASQGEA